MRDDFIVDLWARLKPLIPAKERLDAADALVAVSDEYGFADGLENIADLDRELKTAVKTYFGDYEDEEDDGGW